MTADAINSGLKEMEYREYTDDFGNDRSVSIPAQFRFVKEPSQNTRRFHVELSKRGYAKLDSHPDGHPNKDDRNGVYYDGEICSKDHYLRMDVAVMRGNVVRLYPLDGWEVTAHELGSILDAIEAGFGAGLEHDPIDRSTPTEGGTE